MAAGLIGAAFTFIGLTAILWYFSSYFSLLFLVASLAGAFMVGWFDPRLKQCAIEAEKQEEGKKYRFIEGKRPAYS